jgi:hypothetical protein
MSKRMSLSDCQICRDFLEDAATSIKRHLEALAALALAVQSTGHRQEISALEESVRVCSLQRENIVARYESHLAEHETKTMTAGSGTAG